MRWVKLYEDITEWEWFQDDGVFRLFAYMLVKANYKEKKWQGLVINRGQLVTSLKSLCQGTGLTPMRVRTCLAKLESTGEISQKTTNKFRVITICNYATYQQQEVDEQQTNNKQITNKQQTNNNNIRKKEYIERKEIYIPPIIPQNSFVEPEFEKAFSTWLEYKRQRKESYKSDLSLKTCYNKLYKLSNGDPNTAMAIVEQSMGNNWAGLFELKKDETNRTTYNNSRQTEREQLARGVAATIARRFAEDDARASKVRNS